MPTGPGKCGIPVHVFGIDPRTGIQKHLNGILRAEGRRAVQGRFSPGSDVTHEGFCLHRRFGHAIRIRTIGEQHFEHTIMGLSLDGAQGRMQG